MSGKSEKKALVLGYGRSGRAAEALLTRQGYAVTVLDEGRNGHGGEKRADAGAQAVAEASGRTVPGHEVPFGPDGIDLAVVSPGIAATHPWVSKCREKGVAVVSELQLGCEELRRRGVRLLAVTGSKGKSSVVKIVAEALDLAGMPAVPCGNYGLPVSEVACRADAPAWAVVEVSSFQLETTELGSDAFEAAAILNLQEDHLDRHGSVEVYHALKRHLLDMAKVRIDGSQAAVPAADEAALAAGSYFDNPVLRQNGACAVRLLRAAGVCDADMRRAFLAFEPLPHRMNLVCVRDGVRYIDDSKATSIEALAAGVVMAGDSGIRLIAGGLPKGDDPKNALPSLTGRVKKVYTIGSSAEAFARAWSGAVDCEVCGTVEQAMLAARRDAVAGDCVLLSPGAASFDQFQNFGERGKVFADLAKKGKDK